MVLAAKQELDLTVVMIEHDMALVTRVADRVLVLDFGEVICCDIPQVAVSDPRVIRAYLGGSGDDVVAACHRRPARPRRRCRPRSRVVTANLQILISGISLGCVLALLALGFVVVAKATGVFNLAQGAFVVVGAYLTYTAHQTWGLPFAVALVLSVALVAALAAALEAYDRAPGGDRQPVHADPRHVRPAHRHSPDRSRDLGAPTSCRWATRGGWMSSPWAD